MDPASPPGSGRCRSASEPCARRPSMTVGDSPIPFGASRWKGWKRRSLSGAEIAGPVLETTRTARPDVGGPGNPDGCGTEGRLVTRNQERYTAIHELLAAGE